jgi:hypothetical protein
MLTPPVCSKFRNTSKSSQRSPNLARLGRPTSEGNIGRRTKMQSSLEHAPHNKQPYSQLTLAIGTYT